MRRFAILLIASIFLMGCGAVASPPREESMESLPMVRGEVAKVTPSQARGTTYYSVVMKGHPDVVYVGVPFYNCVDAVGEISDDNAQIALVKPGNQVSFHYKQLSDGKCIADMAILT